MSTVKLIIPSCLMFFSLFVQSQELSSYQWSNRLLLIVSDNPNSPEVKQQISLFADDSLALDERKLLILQVFPEHYLMGANNFVRRQSREIYFDYKSVDRPFQVILIGLDGSEKLRKNNLIMPAELYTIIDSMPMRRSGGN